MLSLHTLHTFRDLSPDGHILSQADDLRFADATPMDHFVLLCVHSALRVQIPSYPLAPYIFTQLTLVITDPDGVASLQSLSH